MKKVSRSVPAPKDLGLAGVIGVPEGATVELDLRLESVMEGVLVTGTAHAPVEGECVRCLEPVERELDADFQEMFSYPDADTRTARRDEAGDDAEDEDTLILEDDLFDLEPVLRDAVVLALPHAAGVPGGLPRSVLRMRSAARGRPGPPPRGRRHPLGGLARTLEQRTARTTACSGAGAAPTRTRRSSRGCSEAEDVAQQHAPPPFAVEGCARDPGGVRALPRAEAPAHRVPELRHLQPPSGPRGLIGG